MGVRRLPVLVLLVLAALPAQSAIAQGTGPQPPEGCIAQTPPAPAPGQNVKLDATACVGDNVTLAWNLDDDEQFNDGTDVIVNKRFASSGEHLVRLRVTDKRGVSGYASRTVNVNHRPVACFTHTPAAPKTGEPVLFDSACSTDSDGTVVAASWDLDGDGYYHDVDARTATRTFARPGTYTVRLGVADDDDALASVTKTITVANRPPVADFAFSPADPAPGTSVTLTSNGADPDGSLASQAWDLDDDGQYDDATGPTATFTPEAARSYSIALRVVDDHGAATVAERAIVVRARPTPPPPTPPRTEFDSSMPVVPPAPQPQPQLPPPATPRLIDPFPVVRMRGRTTRRGARFTLFSVRAPHGATVHVRCSGRGCPAKRLRRKVTKKSKRGARTVRLRRLERFMRADIVLRITIRKPGTIGKYTRIRIRRVKLPVRVDRCLRPGSSKPEICPEAP